MEGQREIRDIIDDIMVNIELLEEEVALLSREAKYKGRILNIMYRIESIRDLLVELKRTGSRGVARQPRRA